MYQQHPTWFAELRKFVFKRAGGICEVDGCYRRAIEVHHVSYPSARREQGRDLLAMCRHHHRRLHLGPEPDDPNQARFVFEEPRKVS